MPLKKQTNTQTMSSDDTRICGYCHTKDHDKCRPVIKWYDKEWYCYCECQTKEGEIMNTIYCPSCDEPTTQAALDKWEMCHNCEKQMCPECGQVFCGHDQ